MFNDTITIYNKSKGADGLEKWRRNVIHGVYWNAIKGYTVRRTGTTVADSVQIIIPYSIPETKWYLPPKEWQPVNAKSFWTLQAGDTVVKGELLYNIEKSTKELQEYDNVYLITSVDFMSFGDDMKHWEVMGK